MGTSDLKNFMQSIFFRGQGAQSFDTVVSVGGVNDSSTSLTYDVNHYDSSGALRVSGVFSGSGGSTFPVSQSGTWSTRIFDSSGNSIIATNTNPVGTEQGLIVRSPAQALQGATAPNSPYSIGAEGRLSDGTPVTSGQLVRIIADSLGKQVVLPGAVNDLHLDGAVQQAGVIATALIANQGAGKKIAMQSLLVTCSGSQTVQVIITGGPNSRTFGFAAPGGGFALAAGGAPLYITSASTALSVNCDATSTTDVFASGYSLGN